MNNELKSELLFYGFMMVLFACPAGVLSVGLMMKTMAWLLPVLIVLGSGAVSAPMFIFFYYRHKLHQLDLERIKLNQLATHSKIEVLAPPAQHVQPFLLMQPDRTQLPAPDSEPEKWQ